MLHRARQTTAAAGRHDQQSQSGLNASSTGGNVDAVKLLKDDHKKVKDLFRQFEKARSADRKKKIAEEAMQELEVHAAIEEEIFYPAAKAKADREGKELVAEAVEEHHVVKVLIGELK